MKCSRKIPTRFDTTCFIFKLLWGTPNKGRLKFKFFPTRAILQHTCTSAPVSMLHATLIYSIFKDLRNKHVTEELSINIPYPQRYTTVQNQQLILPLSALEEGAIWLSITKTIASSLCDAWLLAVGEAPSCAVTRSLGSSTVYNTSLGGGSKKRPAGRFSSIVWKTTHRSLSMMY